MPDPLARGPVPEDLLAVVGHCCGARLTRLAGLENGIDFTPAPAAAADFRAMQESACRPPDAEAPTTDAAE